MSRPGKAWVHPRLCAMILLACAPLGASAEDMRQVLTQKRCNACHDTNAMLIGPPYTAIALRHSANRESMVEVLARKIVSGGGGNWGVVPMVPNDHVTLDEARAMAKWILSLPPLGS